MDTQKIIVRDHEVVKQQSLGNTGKIQVIPRTYHTTVLDLIDRVPLKLPEDHILGTT